MLYIIVGVVHVLVCVVLILVVLLQSGKGADLAGAFGGASTQTAFGSRGPASFLSKLTTVSAVLFMVTCLTLSLIGGGSQQIDSGQHQRDSDAGAQSTRRKAGNSGSDS